MASADSDRDGYADVAALTCAQVAIIYGSRVGLGNRHEFLTSPVPKTRCDRLEDPQGLKALVTGDFNRDSHADLAVTASVPARVFVFMGNDQAIDRNPTVSFSKDPPTTERDYVDYVGNGLAAGDVDGDGDDDLAVGTGIAWIDVTATGVGTIPGFYIVPGSDAGLQVGERRFVHGQRTARLRPKRAEISQSFGHALAIADFDRDGFGDIAVADPEGGRDAGNCELGPCSGAVFILRGSKHGPVVRGRQYWSLSTQLPWGGDDDYAVGNNFGAKLAVGDLDRDGHLDLAIAAPYDQSNYGRPGIHAAAHEWRDVGKVFPNPGNVYVLYGTKNGLSRTGLQIWSQRTRGVPGQAKAFEGFGDGGLQILDSGRDGAGDLLIHTPGDRSGRGSISVVYGSSHGLQADGVQLWHQDMPGIPGRGERGADDGDNLGVV